MFYQISLSEQVKRNTLLVVNMVYTTKEKKSQIQENFKPC